MKQVAFIIPGFKHSPSRKIYQDVIKTFEAKNIEAIPVNVRWKYKTISQNTTDFLKEYERVKADIKYLFGFSYGAVISFLASTQVNPKSIILCSLSPYFKEDLPKLFKSWKKQVGKRRIEDFEKMEAVKLCPKIKSGTFILYGTKEGRFIETRAQDTFKRLQCKKYLIPVKGAKHDIGDKSYLKAISKVIKSI